MDSLISRQAAIDIASGYCHPANIAKELERLPSVQPERKKGKWIRKCNGTMFVCPECGNRIHSLESVPNYCIWCGADMRDEA